jgi:hypothetical protein
MHLAFISLKHLFFFFPLNREFAKEKDRVESRASFLLKKTMQRLDMEIDGYMNWICKAGKTTDATNASSTIWFIGQFAQLEVSTYSQLNPLVK